MLDDQQIITSILDTDFYKLSMQLAVLRAYPDTWVKYRFYDRSNFQYSSQFLEELSRQVKGFRDLQLTTGEKQMIQNLFPNPHIPYADYLEKYRFDPDQVHMVLINDHELRIEVEGPWSSAILWEVPLLALISELRGKQVRNNTWGVSWEHHQDNYRKKTLEKFARLHKNNCLFSDFGTRRRFSKELQEIVVKEATKFSNFLGTSNVRLAMDLGVSAIGTVAHEWTMGVSALEGIEYANRNALRVWSKVMPNAGVALTDTFGSKIFWCDFDYNLAQEFQGVRQDSGDPIDFTLQALEHYRHLEIPLYTKKIVYSNALTINTVLDIHNKFKYSLIGREYGIGTHLTNDAQLLGEVLAPNIVIKLDEVNHRTVVKLSDDLDKATGDPDTIKYTRWAINRRLQAAKRGSVC